jgi:hypothetical protein
MILLSHERQCSSRPTTFGTTPPTRVRFAVLSPIEILHILLEHSYDCQRNENASSARRLHRGSQLREARICSVRSDSSSGGLPSSDRLSWRMAYVRGPEGIIVSLAERIG